MTGRRKNRRERCVGCGLHQELCLCAEIPRIDVATEIIVVQHNRERGKPTNSARLIPMVLERASLIYYAVRDEAFDPTPLQRADTDYQLLFPGEHARELQVPVIGAASQSASESQRRRVLVMLDGSWGQCSRMSHRVPGVADMPQVKLPAGAPGRWGVRTTDDPTRLCSFEAAMRVIGLLHGPEPEQRMQGFFDRLSARMLFMKAKLRSPDVPAQWQSPSSSED